MLYNNNIYVLDAKYYKYGATKNRFDLPESASINKQITYGEYIDAQADLKNPDSVIYNAFLMPFDKNHWAEENAGTLHYAVEAVEGCRRGQRQGVRAYSGHSAGCKALDADCREAFGNRYSAAGRNHRGALQRSWTS